MIWNNTCILIIRSKTACFRDRVSIYYILDEKFVYHLNSYRLVLRNAYRSACRFLCVALCMCVFVSRSVCIVNVLYSCLDVCLYDRVNVWLCLSISLLGCILIHSAFALDRQSSRIVDFDLHLFLY